MLAFVAVAGSGRLRVEWRVMTLVSRATGLPISGKAIRTPMLGFVELAPAELWILDQAPFQRLRRINQLAFSHYVYPGAQHTRFLHTLSVLEMGR